MPPFCLVILVTYFRSDFAGATMCAECLLLLSQAPPWKLPISLTINQYLQTSPQDMDLSSVFALLVIAGFPRVSPCHYKCIIIINNLAHCYGVCMYHVLHDLSDYPDALCPYH